jgi:putative spermidine/putrescine transport system substrate-binding protein
MNMKQFLIIIIIASIFAGIIITAGNLSGPVDDQEERITDISSLSWDEIKTAAVSEGKVIITTWWAEAYFNQIARLFEDKYGIHAEVVVQQNATTLQKIILEKKLKTGTIDIFIAGFAGHLQKALDENIFLPGLKKIPDWDKLLYPDRSYQKNLYIEDLMVPIYRNQVGFLYNPEYVPVPPRSWEDFNSWIKENPKKFVFSAKDDGSGEAFKHSVVYKFAGGAARFRTGSRYLDAEKVKEWQLAWEWFNNNRVFLGFSSSNHDSLKRIDSKDAWITPAFVDDTTIAMKSGLLDNTLKMYVPDFGLFKGGDGAGIVVNAPHKAAAILFLSFLIDRDIQQMMKDLIGSDCIRNDIEIPDSDFLSKAERAHAIEHTDPVYYIYLDSEFKKHVLNE